MSVYETTNEFETAIKANFATHIAAVATDRSVTLDSAFTFYKRERVETFHKRTLPGVGLWGLSAKTGAKRVERRDWIVTMVIDYFARSSDRNKLGEQVELAMEAMMRVVDGLAGSGTLMGASEDEFTTAAIHDIDELIQETTTGPFVAGFRLQVPIRQRDEL